MSIRGESMKKLRLYLDTSVISHLFAEDTPEKMNDTKLFWEKLKANKHEIFISSTVIVELDKCSEPKRSWMHNKLNEINYTTIETSKEVKLLADEYIKAKVLTNKSHADCLHISSAVIKECDLIISWNFKHLVNINTIENVKIVNSINSYKEIGIITPNIFIGDEKDE